MKRFSIVGLGRVGTALSLALEKRGYLLEGMVDRDPKALERAKSLLQGGMIVGTSIDRLPPSSVCLITVNDDAIEAVASQLRKLHPSSLLVHTSGLHTSKILGEGPKLSMHPLQSFASLREAMENLPHSYFTLEGDEAGLSWGRKAVEDIGGVAIEIKASQKPLYHLAACMASNYLITLLYEALKAMEMAGIPPEVGQSGIAILAEGTIKNVKALGIPEALTGPMVRGDVGTVKAHLKATEEHKDVRDFYTFLGLRTLKMISERGLSTPEEALDALENILNKESTHRRGS